MVPCSFPCWRACGSGGAGRADHAADRIAFAVTRRAPARATALVCGDGGSRRPSPSPMTSRRSAGERAGPADVLQPPTRLTTAAAVPSSGASASGSSTVQWPAGTTDVTASSAAPWPFAAIVIRLCGTIQEPSETARGPSGTTRRTGPGPPHPRRRRGCSTPASRPPGLPASHVREAGADANAATAGASRRVPAYGTPSSNRTYPAYDPEARAAVPSTAASEGHFRRRMARAGGMKSGKRGSR